MQCSITIWFWGKHWTRYITACRPVSMQRPRNKHVLTATNSRATTEELLETVFSARSVPRCYITRTPAELQSVSLWSEHHFQEISYCSATVLQACTWPVSLLRVSATVVTWTGIRGNVFTKLLPRNGHLCWCSYYGCQETWQNIL
jgi:hypothetical protein